MKHEALLHKEIFSYGSFMHTYSSLSSNVNVKEYLSYEKFLSNVVEKINLKGVSHHDRISSGLFLFISNCTFSTHSLA